MVALYTILFFAQNFTTMNINKKSTVEEIRNRFDELAEAYSDIEKGQQTAIDSPLCLDLISKAAAIYNPDATNIADLGCGAGNYFVKITSILPDVNVTLVDLSANMLEVASNRVNKNITGKVTTLQSDFRSIDLGKEQFDIIVAATSLHHLRSEDEWELVFSKIYHALKPGGSFWINDVIVHENPALNKVMHRGWFNMLEESIGKVATEANMRQYEIEDTPQSLNYQLQLMHKLGFRDTQILHKHFCFAAFGAVK